MMKRMIKRLGAVALYLVLLCSLLGTEVICLFSPAHIGMFLLGCVILCVPHMEKGFRALEMREIFRRNAITAGYLEAFMLLFGSLNRGDVPQSRIMTELALDMRPLFYGFVCYVILGGREEEAGSGSMEGLPEEMEAGSGLMANRAGETRENNGEENITACAENGVGKESGSGGEASLTRQERNVAELAGRGLTNREIGEELSISEATVKKHMSNIFEKLGIGSRRELK